MPLSRAHWIYEAVFPVGFSYNDVLDFVLNAFSTKENFIIRGLPDDCLAKWKRLGGEALVVGTEAVLNLRRPFPFYSDLARLAAKGAKATTFETICFSEENLYYFNLLKSNANHSNKPLLKYLFITDWSPDMLCFAVKSKTNLDWEAAVLLTFNGYSSLHSELLLRKQNAPAGAMEYLILSIFEELQNNHFTEFSLGETPFFYSNENLLKPLEKITRSLGRSIRFAYNAAGLYQFKKKFRPEFRPVYLYGYKSISFLHLAELYFASNLAKLTWHSLKRSNLKQITQP